MRIKNAKVYQADGTFAETDIVTEGEFIKSDAAADGEIVDAYDLIALPGLVDIRVSQAADTVYDDAGNYAVDKVSHYEAGNGVLAFVGAVELPVAHAKKVAKTVAAWNGDEAARHDDCAMVLGLSLERPLEHIANAKPSPESWKDLAYDDVDTFNDLQSASDGLFKVVDVDAKQEGIHTYVELVSKKATVAVVDNEATFAETEKAIKAGATLVNRRWDERIVLDEKKPGMMDAAFKNDDVLVELVAHEDNGFKKDIVANFALLQGRIVLVAEDGNLFGAMKRAIEMGVPANVAIDAATSGPARALKMGDKVGSLEDGRYANIVLVDSSYNIKHVINRGKMII